jgi:hypothetical protein
MDSGFIDHLYTPFGTALYRLLVHSFIHSFIHSHTCTETSVLSLLQSLLAVSGQWILTQER